MLLQNAHQVLTVCQNLPHPHLSLHSTAGQQLPRIGDGHTSAALVVGIRNGEDELSCERSESSQASVVPTRDDALPILGKDDSSGCEILDDNPQQFLEFNC